MKTQTNPECAKRIWCTNLYLVLYAVLLFREFYVQLGALGGFKTVVLPIRVTRSADCYGGMDCSKANAAGTAGEWCKK